MRSRKVILGLAGIGVLTVASLVGTVIGSQALVDVAMTLLLAGVGLLVIDAIITLGRTERQLRRVKNLVRRTPAPAPAAPAAPQPESPPAIAPADLVGTIRLLQAQYVGRLDRAQASFDAAVERMTDARDSRE